MSKAHAASTFEESTDENLVPELLKIKNKGPKITSEKDELAIKNQDLETEILILRRQLPHLKNAAGKDVTTEFIVLNEKLEDYKRENERLQARLAEYEKNPRFSVYQQSGDSIVSEFSMDRNVAQKLKDVETPVEKPQPILIDYEKEELKEKVKTLEDEIASLNQDLVKLNKVLSGFRKLVPEGADISNFSTLEGENRNTLIKKLYIDLQALDKNWKNNAELVRAINNFLNGTSRSERPSVIIDQLAEERNELKKLMEASDFERTANITNSGELSSFQPKIYGNASIAIDMVMNGSIYPDDLGVMKATFSGFRRLCTQMFQQLQGTAAFLEKLICSLENDEDEKAKEILEKIRSIHLDLNTSMHDASIMIDDAQKAEEGLSAVIERSIRLSMAPDSETIQLTTRLAQLENDYGVASQKIISLETHLAQKDSDVAILENNLAKKDNEVFKAVQKIEELKKIMIEKQQLIDALEKKIQALNDEKTKAASVGKTHVPEIIQEMNNIYSTLNTVSEEVKLLSSKAKTKPSAK